MYAVIETGGKQYRVAPGDVVDVERTETTSGDAIEFERILLIGGEGTPQVGAPVLEGARVKATRVDDVRGPKIRVFKKKRRKGYRRTQGHRQNMVRVRIDEIVA
jgi:large subunit ribosomal protein L21